MKTQDQIKLAQETIKELQDYVELARCQKRLKLNNNIEALSMQITKLEISIKNNVEGL